MKITLLTFLIFLSTTICSQITFQKAYGTAGVEEGRYTDNAIGGGYFVAGEISYFDSTSYDAFIMKVNSVGDTLWTKIIGSNNQYEIPSSIKATSDGGVICLIEQSVSWPTYGFLVKLDSLGNITWTKRIGPVEITYDIIETSDSGFAFTYLMLSKFGIIKTDALGNIQWVSSDSINSYSIENGIELIQTADSGFAMSTTFNNTFDVCLIKTNVIGNIQWAKQYSTPDQDNCYGLRQTSDLGYILFGAKTNAPYSKPFLIKTNSIGDTLWTKDYFSISNGNEYILRGDIFQNSDMGYIFSSIEDGFVNKIILSKTDSTGNIMWTKMFTGNQDDWPDDILITPDNGILISGCTKSYGNTSGLPNIYLIKTDSSGASGCNEVNFGINNEYLNLTASSLQVYGVVPTILGTPPPYSYNVERGFPTSTICSSVSVQESQLEFQHFKLYPNPFVSSTTLEIISSTDLKNTKLEILDLLGRKIESVNIKDSKTEINRDNLSSGIYIIQLISDNQIIGSGKLIVE